MRVLDLLIFPRGRRRRREEMTSLPVLLLIGLCVMNGVEGKKMKISDFSFTAPLYNYSFVENGRSVAKCNDLVRPGVPLLRECKSVEFRVIGGDTDSNGVSSKDRFESSAMRIGNFVFLKIEQRKGQQPLNRELKSHYSLLVRAHCTKRDSSKLETTTAVEIRVEDVNDQSPLPEEDVVEVTVDAQSPPFTLLTCIAASDADAGVNGEPVFSLEGRSGEYTIEPRTGCLRTLRSPLRHNSTTLKVKIEDRASRLFYYDEKTRVEPTTMEVKITVTDRRRDRLNVLVEKRGVERGEEAREGSQIAAVIRVEEERKDEKERESKYEVVILDEHGSGGLFDLRKETATSWTLFTRGGMEIPEKPTVMIRAGSDSAHDRNTTAEITVDTIEMHNITFEKTHYHLNVREDLTIGRPIGAVEATVARREDRKLLKYRIEKTNDSDLPFSIDEESGRIRVKNWLDFENTTEYSFNVMVKLTGYGHQTMTSVTVHVEDANDNAPLIPAKFTRLDSISIPKDAKHTGFPLLDLSTTVDHDSGLNRKIRYRLVAVSPTKGEPPFKIDHETGNITLGRLPSNESAWLIGVMASDRGVPPRIAQVTIGFHKNGTKPLKFPETRLIENKNEHAPVLMEEEEPFEIEEDAEIGMVIGRIPARDEDSSYAGSLRFTTGDHHIDIDDNGTITVARPMTELLPHGKEEALHPFTVTVYDRGIPMKSAERKYAVRIRDVNDHAPVFEKPWYRISLPENTAVGTVIMSVKASDLDGGENGRVRYELAGWNTVSDEENRLITVDEKSGEITLRGELDREESESHRLTLMAYDGGSPSRISFANLTIIVEDVNDNTPRCAQQVMKVSISEDYPDGALVGCLAVHDEDGGANGRLVYGMESEKMENREPFPFRVDRHSGCVFVKSKHPLDYEKRRAYNLSIEVSDNGESPLTTICQMEIGLLDVNENRHPPAFQDTVMEASVYENEPIGTLVMNLVVTDDDGSGNNATIEIVGGDGRAAFTVVGGNVLTAQILDRERKAEYWITVRATDNAPVPLSSHLFIYIRVLDKSDHSPVFKQPFYAASVAENAAPDTVVVKVEAEDADWPPSGKTAELRYAITAGDPQSFFNIDPLTGYITTGGSRKLDRETQRMHELEVRVTTSDEREMNSGVVRVFVRVEDENDNGPVFINANKHEYEVPVGRKGRLCRILAFDADEGRNAELHYAIKTLDPGFEIDAEGYVVTSKELREGQMSSLDVIVRDGGEPARETSRRIVMSAVKMDGEGVENNHAPQFAQQELYKFDVSDADQVGTPIGILSAKDEDGHRLWWSIVEDSSNYSSFFDINPRTGYLILAQPVERLPADVGKIRLTVRVSDGRAESEGKVRIQLARQPLSRPVFDQTHYEITLSEKTPIGTTILSPIATGYGTRPIEYGIQSTESARAASTVGVDPSTGNVMLIGALDYEAERRFRIVLSAKQGTLVGFSMVSIRVVDENDNPPVFTQLEYEVTVPSNTSAGTVVATVTAFDSDEGENGLIVYDILSGNELGFFSIDRESGEIRTTKEMEHSEHYESILSVRAADRGGEGSSMMSGMTTVRVRTEGEGKEGGVPKFERSLYHLSVRENAPVGSLLLAVRASSPDGHVRYETGKKCSWIEVHPVSGAVRLKRWLTKIRSKSVNCTIVAKGTGEGQATTKVVFRVIETNEHSPVFRQQIYRGTVRENATSGIAVQSLEGGPLVVSATDKDTGTNALIGYRLIADDPYFTVDLLSGTIRTRRSLDYEKLSEWRFHVTAHDMGHPPRYSSLPALVIVQVEDINDASPIFDQPAIDVDLVLPSVAGVRLVTVRARDVDTVGEIRYYAREEEKQRGLWRVDRKSGDVILMTGDRKNFTEKSYKLEVVATDGVHTASQEVRIKVKNASQSDLRFAQTVYVAAIEEGVKVPGPMPLVTVQASVVSDPSAEVIYQLLNTREDFSIVPSTGLISYTGEGMDREEEDHVLLLVQARSTRTSSLTGQCIVRVSVGDVNDNAPRFTGLPYHGAVTIKMKKGTKVLQLHAVDADAGANGTVTYSSDDLPSMLELNGKSGKISVKREAEKKEGEMVFTVKATDGGTPPLSTSTSVRVEMVDSLRPRFERREWRGRVGRGAKRGEEILRVEGRGEGEGRRMVYTIEEGDEERRVEMDVESGVISLRDSSWIEEGKGEIRLRVAVRDAIRPTMRDEAEVVIELDPSSIAPPLSFTNSSYRVRVSEETPVGEPLMKMEMREEEGEVELEMEGEERVFHLDASSGVLSLASPLDYEKQRMHVVRVSGWRKGEKRKEERGRAKATVVVEVLDANDETPVFIHPFAAASIPDSARIGDFVTMMRVEDKDTVSSLPEGARLLYSVIDGDDTLFTVDKRSGVVLVGREIEEEDLVERKKLLNVSVSDGLQTSFGRLTIDIVETGSRSKIPRFEQSQYVVSMKESSMRSPSTAITRVRAIGGVAPLHYALGGGLSASWPVGIDHATGKIHMKTKIGRDEKDFIIPLIASDSLGRKAFSTLTIRVVEENDHSPTFPLSEYSCSISSSSKVGESLVSLWAMDEDEGDTMEYAIMGEARGMRVDQRSGMISMGPDGRLSSLIGSTISLIVRATDGGNPPHSASVPLTMNVLPSDIPIPRFANSLYRFSVAEDAAVGFLVGRIQQIASDVGEIRYEMRPAADLPFSVDNTGKITVQALLDREKRRAYRFVLYAHAAEGAHALTTVSIEIEDVNDNAPLFRGSYEGMSVREDAPIGTSIGVFSATDEDESSRGKISYELMESPSSSDLSLDPSSGWLSVASPLDRERRGEYRVKARVKDQGGMSSHMEFVLKIEDVNDEAAVFDERNYTIRIDPSLLADSQTIGRVTVKDADLPPNNTTQLYIVRGNEDGHFSIDNTGRITVAERGTAGLIAAGVRKTDLEVLAHDGVHSTTVVVTIISTPSASTTVECPMGDTVVRVKESVEVGYRLELERAEWKNAAYSIIPSPEGVKIPFSIDEQSGDVKTTQKLDREKVQEYSFARKMISTGSGPSFSPIECEERVRVKVEDVNDNGPVFEKELYEVGVKENEPASEGERVFLVRVHARDEDGGRNGRVSYALLPHSDNAPFRLDPLTGVITLVETLDREKKDEYQLAVIATDGGGEMKRSAKATVKISVADQNDNAPEFERKEYATRIMESESVGYEILTVAAIGGDEGEKVKYELVEGHKHNQYVQIGEESGILKLSSPVDYEKEKELEVVIRATDSGSPPLSSETKVKIEIMDENDNLPVWEKEKESVRVREDVKEGEVVVKVTATDADSVHLGTVEYSIEEREEGGGKGKGKKDKKHLLPFEIGRETGEVKVKGRLDYEKTKEYQFEIRATDGGGRYSVMEMRVELEDVNDNPPVFGECNLTAIAQKSVSAGHVLLSLSISDADSEENGGPPFKMEIEGEGKEALSIDDRLNVITTSKLERVDKERLVLKVRATDRGGLSAECPLVVDVKEESTHPPTVAPLSVKLNLLHGEYTGGDIGWVMASDEDEEDRNDLRYGLMEESVRSPEGRGTPHLFKVSQEVGSLWAAPGITPGTHTMNVSVTDGKFYAYAPVTVEVEEISETAIEHTMVVRVEGTVAEFFASHKKAFKAAVSNVLNIKEDQIRILSVVERNEGTRRTRAIQQSQKAVDVAFIAYRRPGAKSGLMSPKQFYLKAEKGDQGLKRPFSVEGEMCGLKSCRGGDCRDEVLFIDGPPKKYTVKDEEGEGREESLIMPPFERRRSCRCPQGKGGLDCSEEVNGCARSKCAPHEMCIPLMSGRGGRVDCVCPPSTEGEKCAKRQEGVIPSLHVDGQAFIEIDLPASLEREMEISIEMRTTTREGYLMWTEGEEGDYHALQIKSGAMTYSWNAGRGETSVESTIEVADGEWHRISVTRKGRSVEMRVDEGAKIMGEGPAGGEVVNLWRWSRTLVLGAKVKFDPADPSIFELSKGLSACIRQIRVNDQPLVLTSNGLRLFAAKIGCRELPVSPCYGPNSTALCKNDGKCIPTVEGSFSCECSSPRFSGRDCSVDRDPCGLLTGDSPCPAGVACLALEGRPQCQCPLGHTGERCEIRDKNFVPHASPCEPNPCGKGSCIDITRLNSNIGNNQYICKCGEVLRNACEDEEGVSAFLALYAKEMIVGLVAMVIIAAIAFFIYKFCRYRSEKKDSMIYDDHVYTPHGVNPNLGGGPCLPSTGHSTLIQPPPPLPPRTFRNGRPTIEVRPYAGDERVGSSRGDSGDSLNGSFGKMKRGNGGMIREDWREDDMSRSMDNDSSAMRDLEALRRIGLPLPELDGRMGGGRGGGGGEAPAVHDRRRVRGREGRDRGESMVEERLPLGDDWRGVGRSTPMNRIDDAVRTEQERRRRQAGGERMRVEESGGGKIMVADTLLSPVENDPEYMTMRPRGVSSGASKGKGGGKGMGSGGSQKRPLLAAAEEEEESSEGTDAPLSHRPPLPLHGEKGGREEESEMYESRLYDDPHYDSSQMYRKSEATSNMIGDMDATDDEEAPPLPREAPPTEA